MLFEWRPYMPKYFIGHTAREMVILTVNVDGSYGAHRYAKKTKSLKEPSNYNFRGHEKDFKSHGKDEDDDDEFDDESDDESNSDDEADGLRGRPRPPYDYDKEKEARVEQALADLLTQQNESQISRHFGKLTIQQQKQLLLQNRSPSLIKSLKNPNHNNSKNTRKSKRDTLNAGQIVISVCVILSILAPLNLLRKWVASWAEEELAIADGHLFTLAWMPSMCIEQADRSLSINCWAETVEPVWTISSFRQLGPHWNSWDGDNCVKPERKFFAGFQFDHNSTSSSESSAPTSVNNSAISGTEQNSSERLSARDERLVAELKANWRNPFRHLFGEGLAFWKRIWVDWGICNREGWGSRRYFEAALVLNRRYPIGRAIVNAPEIVEHARRWNLSAVNSDEHLLRPDNKNNSKEFSERGAQFKFERIRLSDIEEAIGRGGSIKGRLQRYHYLLRCVPMWIKDRYEEDFENIKKDVDHDKGDDDKGDNDKGDDYKYDDYEDEDEDNGENENENEDDDYKGEDEDDDYEGEDDDDLGENDKKKKKKVTNTSENYHYQMLVEVAICVRSAKFSENWERPMKCPESVKQVYADNCIGAFYFPLSYMEPGLIKKLILAQEKEEEREWKKEDMGILL